MAAPWFNGVLVAEKQRLSFPAGSTSLQQYQFVTLNGSGQLVTPSNSTSYCFVLDDAPAIIGSGATYSDDLWSGGYTVGAQYGVVWAGVQKVIAGGQITAMTAVQSNTSGQAVTATGTNVVQGIALGTAASGDLISIAIAWSVL